MTNTIRPLTTDETAALHAFAAKHGRNWKQELETRWYHASEPGLLHALRNDPRWSFEGLNAYKLPK